MTEEKSPEETETAREQIDAWVESLPEEKREEAKKLIEEIKQ